MKRIHRLIFPAFVLILVLACQAFNTHTLSGTKWELVSYGPLNSPVLPLFQFPSYLILLGIARRFFDWLQHHY